VPAWLIKLSSLLILSWRASPTFSPKHPLLVDLIEVSSSFIVSLLGGPPHPCPPLDVLTAALVVIASRITDGSVGLYLEALETMAKTPPPCLVAAMHKQEYMKKIQFRYKTHDLFSHSCVSPVVLHLNK
jgi:hypothetical protein